MPPRPAKTPSYGLGPQLITGDPPTAEQQAAHEARRQKEQAEFNARRARLDAQNAAAARRRAAQKAAKDSPAGKAQAAQEYHLKWKANQQAGTPAAGGRFQKELLADPVWRAEQLKDFVNDAAAAFANGGEGSGNFGHSGRPGEVGGSGLGGATENAAIQRLREVLSGKTDETVYAHVTPETATQIKAATGLDVSGSRHFVDRDALTHIHKQHGVGREDQPGHLPITQDDLERIPAIVAHPDKVENGGISGRDAQTIKYTKRFNGTTYYVEEVWKKEKLLAAKTMFKKETPK